jgi:ABC-type multidrug transport system fused ATPase/permease subunit
VEPLPPKRPPIRSLLAAARALLARGGPSLAVVASVVLVQRLALPLSVIWLGEQGPKAAAGALFGAAALSFVRARAADRLARAVRLNLLELYLRPFERGPVASLPHHEAVTARLAVALPTLVGWAIEGVSVVLAAAVAVPLVALLLAYSLGASALLPLGVAGAVGAGVTMAASPRVEAAWTRAWDRSRALLETLGAGYEGAVDLRAHGRAHVFADRLRAHVSGWSIAEGRARTLSAVSSWGALGATLAAALASSALLSPTIIAEAPSEGMYRAFMLILAAVPTLHTLVGGIANLLYARDELAVVERQRVIAASVAESEVDEPIDATAELRLSGVDFTYEAAPDPAASASAGADPERPPASDPSARAGRPRRTAALRGVSLVLGAGESLIITGPNGSGKTTLLHILLGVARPSAGRVLVGGREARLDNRRFRERVAFLSQHPFELRDGSIAENLRAFDPAVPDARLIAELTTAGLWPRLRARAPSDAAALALPYAELSQGEQRRVMLARALLRDADLLVLDEPEAHLDAASVTELAAVLARLARDRRVIAAIHDPSLRGFEARSLALQPPARPGGPRSV